MHPTDVLRYGNDTLMAAVESLPDTAWDAPGACGHWSAKDVMAHMACYELLLGDVLAGVLERGEPTPTLDHMLSGEAFNDAEVEARVGRSAAEVRVEYGTAHDRVYELANALPGSAWREAGILTWYGPDYDLEDFVAYASYGHKREHAAQLAVVRDRFVEAT